jgi:hypothetical protein
MADAPPRPTPGKFRAEYDAYLKDHLGRLDIRATTVTPSGQTIDWIPLHSQGEICAPPPLPKPHKPDPRRPAKPTKTELQLEGVERGPEGTVPLVRPDFRAADFSVPVAEFWVKRPVPLPAKEGDGGDVPRLVRAGTEGKDLDLPEPEDGAARSLLHHHHHQHPDPARPKPDPKIPLDAQAPTPHWYANVDQSVNAAYGTSCILSVNTPSVDHPADFALLELSLMRVSGASRPARAAPSNSNSQTVEAGWHVCPLAYGGDKGTHLFSYFTTTGYSPVTQNEVGGYNATCSGWVQVAGDVTPGIGLANVSVEGGAQIELAMAWQLHNGNFWLFVKDHWIGYYPARLFVTNPLLPAPPNDDPSGTLADHGDCVSFFGEVADSVDLTAASSPTTTDMGSGQFADMRWARSAYIHNMEYQATPSTDGGQGPPGGNPGTSGAGGGQMTAFGGGVNDFHYDPSRYSVESHVGSGGNWGSYVWLGGPGFLENVA